MLLTTVLFTCRGPTSQQKEELGQELCDLFSPAAGLAKLRIEIVTVEQDGRTVNFNCSPAGLQIAELKTIMSGGFVSNPDTVGMHSNQLRRAGTITVNNAEARRSFDLFRGEKEPELFAVETPSVDSFNTGILYFVDKDGRFKKYFASPASR